MRFVCEACHLLASPPSIIGRTTAETVHLVAPDVDAEAEALLMETAEADDTDGLVPFAGAASLLGRLPIGRWAIATSGKRRTAVTRLAHTGLPSPHVLITADDVARGKPAPDPYLLAAERLGILAARCVVVEDAPAGIASARAAGARVIAIASTMSREALGDADAIVPRLEDLTFEMTEGALCLTPRVAA